MKAYDCPKCKEKNTVRVSVTKKEFSVVTDIFRCINEDCKHQVQEIEELI